MTDNDTTAVRLPEWERAVSTAVPPVWRQTVYLWVQLLDGWWTQVTHNEYGELHVKTEQISKTNKTC